MAQIRISMVKDITWRSQQPKSVHFLELNPFGTLEPPLEPPLRWDRWQIMLKLAIMAKEGISIDTLFEDPPDKVILPPEAI